MPVAFPKPVKAPKAPRKRLVARAPMRRSWMMKRRPRRLDGPGTDVAYLVWVREQPCAATFAGAGPHAGRTEAHHAGKNPGIGMKADDRTAMPLCQGHHGALTDKRGPFKTWTREALREWQDEQSAASYARYLSSGSRRGP